MYGSFAPLIHIPSSLNTIIRFSSLIRLYACVSPCLVCYLLVSGLFNKRLANGMCIFLSPSFVCMSPVICFKLIYIPWYPIFIFFCPYAMIIISFLSPPFPPTFPCPSSDSPELKFPWCTVPPPLFRRPRPPSPMFLSLYPPPPIRFALSCQFCFILAL